MRFERLNEKYLEDAVKLAQADYDMERMHMADLFEKDFKIELTNCISEILNYRYGAVALQNDILKGFIGFIGPWDGHFGNVKGVFSPLHANSVSGDNKGKIASQLFQYASQEMVADGIFSFAVGTYSHNYDVISSYVLNGFGIRCSDAIRKLENPLNIEFKSNYSYEEISHSDAGCLLKLKNSLISHLIKSPTFFPCPELSAEEFINQCNHNKSRFFLAKDRSELIGYIEITDDGETFISEAPDMLNICGAYLDENYRGKNVLQSLLSFVIDTLKKDGIKYLGVDYDTINPTALRFWSKYFDSYTYSFNRRIDERISKI